MLANCCLFTHPTDTHPSIQLLAMLAYHWGSWGGCWKKSQLTLHESQGTPWTGRQAITGLMHRNIQPFTFTFTPTSNLELPINLCSLQVFGLREETGAPGGNPHRHGENMALKPNKAGWQVQTQKSNFHWGLCREAPWHFYVCLKRQHLVYALRCTYYTSLHCLRNLNLIRWHRTDFGNYKIRFNYLMVDYLSNSTPGIWSYMIRTFLRIRFG